jgi:predicted nucleic acid-binding protein
MPPCAIGNAIDEIANACSVATISIGIVKNALQLHSRYGYSYYDCLMLASALALDCKYLFTEDMQNGHIVDKTLTIVNPFL